MNPTIREVIKRRVWWLTAPIAIAIMLFFGLTLLQPPGTRPDPRFTAPALLLAAGGLLGLNYLKCPKCRGPFGQQLSWRVGFAIRRRVNYCPYCGVSLDEPLNPAGTAE